MINNRISKPVPAFTATQIVYTCSTGDVTSGSAVNGAIIDRLGLGGSSYPNQVTKGDFAHVAKPFCFVWSTLGSTFADRKIAIDCKLQHGDSSGGGDMADLSTQDNAIQRVYWTTAHTTDMANWSTGPEYLHSNVADYAISAAKRFLRPVSVVTKNGNTTAATGADRLYVVQGVVLDEFTYTPPSVLSGFASTTT